MTSDPSFDAGAPLHDTSPEPFTRRHGRLLIIILLGVVAIGIALMERQRLAQKDGPHHPLVGKTIPEIALQPFNSGEESFTTQSMRGKVTLINFWGPWCPPCRLELPHLAKLFQDVRNHPDFQLVTVTCRGTPGQSLASLKHDSRAALAELPVALPVYFDDGQAARRQLIELGLPDFAYPTTIVVDRDLIIRAVWRGYAPGMEKDQRAVVEALLNQ